MFRLSFSVDALVFGFENDETPGCSGDFIFRKCKNTITEKIHLNLKKKTKQA